MTKREEERTVGHVAEDPAASPMPSQVLDAHHQEVERVCNGLLCDTLADDPRTLVARWRWFERAVLEHMAAEDELVVPGYAVAHADDARRIRDEHVAIRTSLAALGLEVELHLIRATTVRAMIDGLRAHAAHEEEGMYKWASRHLRAPIRSALRTRLHQAGES